VLPTTRAQPLATVPNDESFPSPELPTSAEDIQTCVSWPVTHPIAVPFLFWQNRSRLVAGCTVASIETRWQCFSDALEMKVSPRLSI
jgi:hypothetical protein